MCRRGCSFLVLGGNFSCRIADERFRGNYAWNLTSASTSPETSEDNISRSRGSGKCGSAFNGKFRKNTGALR